MGAIRWAPRLRSTPHEGIPGDYRKKAHGTREVRDAKPRVSGGEALQNENGREEWEVGKDLRQALGRLPLQPAAGRDGHLAGLGPHLEEALGTLGRLERRRGLSGEERVSAEALRVLLEAAREVG